jgi:hypothetical protein
MCFQIQYAQMPHPQLLDFSQIMQDYVWLWAVTVVGHPQASVLHLWPSKSPLCDTLTPQPNDQPNTG